VRPASTLPASAGYAELADLVRDAREEGVDAAQVGLTLELLVDRVIRSDGRLGLEGTEVASVATLAHASAQGGFPSLMRNGVEERTGCSHGAADDTGEFAVSLSVPAWTAGMALKRSTTVGPRRASPEPVY